jgi:hypothetical protein
MAKAKAKAKGRGRGRAATGAAAIEARERQRRALELRKAGLTLQEIADALGYAQPCGAFKAIKVAMERIPAEAVGDLRKLESERLDAMQAQLWRQALAGNPRAVEQVLKIMTRRARLLGLDHAMAVDMDVTSGGKPLRFECDPEFGDWAPPQHTAHELEQIEELEAVLEDVEGTAV